MSAELATPRAVGDIAAGALVCASAAVAVMAGAATAVTLIEAGDDLRRALRFGFGGVERSPGEAMRIALHNARLAAATLLCAAVTPLLPRWARRFVAAVLGGVLVLNAGIVGLAFGAYGERLAVAVAGHLPLEFGALSIAGGSYLAAVRGALTPRTLASVACVCAVLLLIAAVAETYASEGVRP